MMANTNRLFSTIPRVWKVISINGLPREQHPIFQFAPLRCASTAPKVKTEGQGKKGKGTSNSVNRSTVMVVKGLFEEKPSISESEEKKEQQESDVSVNFINSVTQQKKQYKKTSKLSKTMEETIRVQQNILDEEIPKIQQEENIDVILELMVNNFDQMRKLKVQNGAQNDILVEGLKRIAMLKKKDKSLENVRSNETFIKIIDRMEKDYNSLHGAQLINCLLSLLDIFPNDIHLIQLLENKAMWESRRLDVGSVVYLFRYHRNHQETKLRSKVIHHLEDIIRRRVVELKKVNDITFVMQVFAKKRDDKVLADLEEQIFDVASNMTIDELSSVLYSMSMLGSRQPSLIRLLTVFLNKRYETRTTSQIATLLFSCAKLSIYEESLLKKISADLLMGDLSNMIVDISVLKSCSFLGWLYEETLAPVIDHILSNVKDLNVEQLESTLMSLATLNFCPSDKLEILQSLCSKLMDNPTISPVQWLNIVWSLTVLQKSTPAMLSSVLTEQFGLKISKECVTSWQYEPKLININSAAKWDVEGYKGPYLADSFLTNYHPPEVNSKKKEMVTAVLKTLHGLAPLNTFCRTDVTTPSGYRIEAELYVDSKVDFVELEKAESSPEKFHRVAVKVLGFHDQLLPNNQPKGSEAMTIRYLEKEGYKVLKVLSNEWNFMTTPDKKTEHIQMQIKNVLSSQSDLL